MRTLSPELDALYADSGRPSIAPEYILRALLLQVFYSVRSERLLVEQIDYNLLFRWFVGLGMDDAVWNHAVFSRTAPKTAPTTAMKRTSTARRRSNKTHESTTDADARLYRKSYGKESKLSYLGMRWWRTATV